MGEDALDGARIHDGFARQERLAIRCFNLLNQTARELMLLGGRYRSLYEKQYGVAINRFVNEGEELKDLAAK